MSISTDTLAKLDILEKGVSTAKYLNAERKLQDTDKALDTVLKAYVECRDTIPDDSLRDSVMSKLSYVFEERRERVKLKMEEIEA